MDEEIAAWRLCQNTMFMSSILIIECEIHVDDEEEERGH